MGSLPEIIGTGKLKTYKVFRRRRCYLFTHKPTDAPARAVGWSSTNGEKPQLTPQIKN